MAKFLLGSVFGYLFGDVVLEAVEVFKRGLSGQKPNQVRYRGMSASSSQKKASEPTSFPDPDEKAPSPSQPEETVAT